MRSWQDILVVAGLILLTTPGWAQPKIKTLKTAIPKKYEVITQYPIFQERTPLANFAETRIAAWARRTHDDFVKMARRDFANPENTPMQGMEYAQEIKARITLYRPARLISVRMDGYTFTGGAHPNPFVNVFNFARVNGVTRSLTLNDLFRPGSNSPARVSDRVLAKLKAKGASLVVNGDIKRLTADQRNRFVVLPDGLLFIFPPYDVASYAEGQFEIKLPLAELGPDFNRALLAR